MSLPPSARRPATDARALAARRRQQAVAISVLAFGASWALVASHPADSTTAASTTAQSLPGSTSTQNQPSTQPTPTFFSPNAGSGAQTAPSLRSTSRRGAVRSGGS